LAAKKVKPPYIPPLDGNSDLSNIDKMFTREAPRETPEEEDRLLKKAKFEEFTYVEKSGFLNSSYREIN
jgi:Protein kinase C terminal domain